MAATGKKQEALNELSCARAIATRLGNPALEVVAAAALLAVEPDEAVAVGGRDAVNRILSSLSDPDMRKRFLGAEPVRAIAAA